MNLINPIECVYYQRQDKVEQCGAAVEQYGEQRGGCGYQQTNISTHHHPQRLQYLPQKTAYSLICQIKTLPITYTHTLETNREQSLNVLLHE